jgi:hypothetical protein
VPWLGGALAGLMIGVRARPAAAESTLAQFGLDHFAELLF